MLSQDALDHEEIIPTPKKPRLEESPQVFPTLSFDLHSPSFDTSNLSHVFDPKDAPPIDLLSSLSTDSLPLAVRASPSDSTPLSQPAFTQPSLSLQTLPHLVIHPTNEHSPTLKPYDGPTKTCHSEDRDSQSSNDNSDVVFIENESDCLAYQIMRNFPYTSHPFMIPKTFANMTLHISTEPNVDASVFHNINLWFEFQLKLLPRYTPDWQILYQKQPQIWEQVGDFFQKLITRKDDFGQNFTADSLRNDLLPLMFNYANITTKLLISDCIAFKENNSFHPVSSGHIRLLHMCLSRIEEPGLFHLLEKVYSIDFDYVFSHLIKSFLGCQLECLEHIVYLCKDNLCISGDANGSILALNCLALFDDIAKAICYSQYEDLQTNRLKCEYPPLYLQVFRSFDNVLLSSLTSSSSVPIDFRRKLFSHLTRMVSTIVEISPSLRAELCKDFINVSKLTSFPIQFTSLVVIIFWKIKRLKEFICKGRMDVRVLGIELLSFELIDLWKARCSINLIPGAVLQLVGELILEENIVEIILGIDSHPQLIARSGNIIGFLIVTDFFDQFVAPVIWDIMGRCTDGQIFNALFDMMSSSLNLFNETQLLDIFRRFDDLPFSSFTQEVFNFSSAILRILNERGKVWTENKLNICPYYLFRNLIKKACRKDTFQHNVKLVYVESMRLLSTIGRLGSQAARRKIYLESASYYLAQEYCDGDVEIIFTLCKEAKGDLDFLFNELDIATHVLIDLGKLLNCTSTPSSVESNRPYGDNSQLKLCDEAFTLALRSRLDFLIHLLVHGARYFTDEQLMTFWSYIILLQTMQNSSRDYVWTSLSRVLKNHELDLYIVKRLANDLLPMADPFTISPMFFEFIRDVTEYLLHKTKAKTYKQSFYVPCEIIIWKIILLAIDEDMADRAMNLFTQLHCNLSVWDIDKKDILAAAQDILIQRCLTILQVTAVRIMQQTKLDDWVVLDQLDKSIIKDSTTPYILFSRVFKFMGTLLQYVRKFPPYSLLDQRRNLLAGVDYELKYQTFGDNKCSGIGCLKLNEYQSMGDLRNLLVRLTKWEKFELFVGGRRYKFDHSLNLAVKDLALDEAGFIIVRKLPGSFIHFEAIVGAEYSSAEKAIAGSFEIIYNFLDCPGSIARVAFEFLGNFVPGKQLCIDLMHAGVKEILNVNKPMKSQFTLICFEKYLKEGLGRISDDKTIVEKVFELLCTYILRLPDTTGSNTPAGYDDLQLTSRVLHNFYLVLCEEKFVEITNKYCDKINSLVDRIMIVIDETADIEGTVNLVKNCYMSLIRISMTWREGWNMLSESPSFEALHKRLLLNDNVELRESIVKDIKSALRVTNLGEHMLEQSLANYFWRLATTFIQSLPSQRNYTNSLFSLATDLVNHLYGDESTLKQSTGTIEELRDHMTIWQDILLRHRHNERPGVIEADYTVIGLCQLLEFGYECLRKMGETIINSGLIEVIFERFLFPNNSNNEENDTLSKKDVDAVLYPVVDGESRSKLYSLVTVHGHDHEGFKRIIKAMWNSVKDDPGQVGLYDVDTSLRSEVGYVGIKNLGNTCYMNSLLSQFYMNIDFREFFMNIDTSNEFRKNESLQLLRETQRLMGAMQESHRKAIDAEGIARSIRTHENEDIDVAIQMDVEEFFNLLYEQWERQIPTNELKKRFGEFYAGETINQIKSLECEHVSERVEIFTTLQCDVKGKASLSQSLSAFVEGELMVGENKYRCESCGGKLVEAVKRTCVKRFAQNVIFHLKRFDFDVSRMQRNKIDDYFEFPLTIDLSGYTVEHLGDGEGDKRQDFELVGVLLHKGVAEHGHYFSCIRTPGMTDDGEAIWVKYDDAEVEFVKAAEVREKCFGGVIDGEEKVLGKLIKGCNAYMLFYKRAADVRLNEDRWKKADQLEQPRVNVPEDIAFDIALDNVAALREYCMFESEHARFLEFIINGLSKISGKWKDTGRESGEDWAEVHDLHMEGMKVIVNQVHQVFGRLENSYNLTWILERVEDFLRDCCPCYASVIVYMIRDEGIMQNLLVRSSEQSVREMVMKFLVNGLRYIKQEAWEIYGERHPDNQDWSKGATEHDKSHEGLLSLVVEELRDFLSVIHAGFRSWEELFGIFVEIAKVGDFEVEILLWKGVFEMCMEWLVGHYDEGVRRLHERAYWIMERKRPACNRLAEIVGIFLEQVDVNWIVESKEDRLKEGKSCDGKFPITRWERDMLVYWDEENKCSVLFGRILDLWNAEDEKEKEFIPGSVMLRMIEQIDGHNGTKDANIITDQIRQTLHGGISYLLPGFSDAYLKAAAIFCGRISQRHWIREMVKCAVGSCLELDNEGSGNGSGCCGRGGQGHLNFFALTWDMTNEPLSVWMDENEKTAGRKYREGLVKRNQYIYRWIVKTIKNWGIVLLKYDKWEVRINTLRLIMKMLELEYDIMSKEDTKEAYPSTEGINGCSKLVKKMIYDAMYKIRRKAISECLDRIIQVLRASLREGQTEVANNLAEVKILGDKLYNWLVKARRENITLRESLGNVDREEYCKDKELVQDTEASQTKDKGSITSANPKRKRTKDSGSGGTDDASINDEPEVQADLTVKRNEIMPCLQHSHDKATQGYVAKDSNRLIKLGNTQLSDSDELEEDRDDDDQTHESNGDDDDDEDSESDENDDTDSYTSWVREPNILQDYQRLRQCMHVEKLRFNEESECYHDPCREPDIDNALADNALSKQQTRL